jgi:peptide/nickel transport system substrate-binding protein
MPASDPAKARGLLKEAGYPDGFQVSLPVHQGSLEEATILKNQLQKVGVTININLMDRGAYRSLVQKRDFSLVIAGGNLEPDPDSFYYETYHSRFVDSLNFSGYQNPRMDALLEEGQRKTGFKERKEIYRQVVELLQRDLPEIFLTTEVDAYGARGNVKGFSVNPRGDYGFVGGGFGWTWLER